jgi:hypothetical protein
MRSFTAFPLGRVVFTPSAFIALVRHKDDPIAFFERHRHGDWGLVDEALAAANDQATWTGGRIRSEFETAGGNRVCVVTEADRSYTCFLLADED